MRQRCKTDFINITISMDPETKKMIDEIQEKDKRSRSWIICDAIREYYENLKSNKLDNS